jgi:hypothetical protein
MAGTAFDWATVLSTRLTLPSFQRLNLPSGLYELRTATNEDWEKSVAGFSIGLEQPEYKSDAAAIRAATAPHIFARLGHADEALCLLATLLTALGISNVVVTDTYTATVCDAADTLWVALVTGAAAANAPKDSEARAELGAMTRQQLAERHLRAGASEDAGELLDTQQRLRTSVSLKNSAKGSKKRKNSEILSASPRPKTKSKRSAKS